MMDIDGCESSFYEQLFDEPILDSSSLEAHQEDKIGVYYLIHRIAENHPTVALHAVQSAVETYYRNDHPFGYSIGEKESGRARGDGQ
ncbi:hypothetical protein GGP72_000131 [Salinibacter ruber]|jgi:hypothetical protein|uniref:Uncharacterized protein n=1 Tax=Salinibacter ruber TaxID=146919 RepID=A0A9X2PT12_9BACT|nr:hypothetical protein [Salinibacter ruber]MCS3676235.1 hypothetical protein [Salinibacter ruber]MCS3679522.1 hypothetical protein [Salinibacter ruber]MCS4178471.1 hypothetical protein [Salinibacter ruber]